MTNIRMKIPAGMAVLAFALAGCENGILATPPEEAAPGTVLQEARTEIRVVERPDIFETTELGLWDGRPTLGRGAWIAHPDVEAPEGVRVRNLVNGTSIRAALYRRERLSPGPRLQLSSAAAAELGVLAGQPTELEVVVVRDEEVVIEPAIVVPEPEEMPVDAPDTALAEAEPDDATGDDDALASAAGTGAAVAAGAAAGAAAATVDEPAHSRLFRWIRNTFSTDPGDVAPSPEPITDASIMPETAETAAVPDVETAPLGAVAAASAALANVEAEENARQASGDASYIQVGLYGEQANASAAASSLRQAGILPTIRDGQGANGPFWRVLVGPTSSAAEQRELLAQVQSIGYDDAYLTQN